MKTTTRYTACIVSVLAICILLFLSCTTPSIAHDSESENQTPQTFDETAHHPELRDSDDEDDFDDEIDEHEADDFEEDEGRDDHEDFDEADWDDEDDAEESEDLEELEARIAQALDVASDEMKTAAFVLDELAEHTEPEDALPILQSAASNTNRPVLKRLIWLKLMVIYHELDQPTKANQIASQLITGKI